MPMEMGFEAAGNNRFGIVHHAVTAKIESHGGPQHG